MAFVTADRVKDTSTTTGTGNITVSGSAPFGYRTFSTVLSVSDTFYYCIQGQSTSEWEVGLGTYVSSNQFARTTVLASSASGSAVSFSSGTKNVFITLPANKTLQFDATGTPTAGGVLYGTGSMLAYSTAGTAGQALVSGGTGAPTWSTVTGLGTVTSVNVSGGSTGLTYSGGPITGSGAITMAGTLAVANGGTGLTTTPANGALDIGNGTGFTRTTLTAGSNITITNTSGAISIAANTPNTIANGTSNVAIASSNGSIVATTNGTTALTIDTSGNLLVGATNGTAKVYVKSVSTTAATAFVIERYDTTDKWGQIIASNNDYYFNLNGTGKGYINNSTGAYTAVSDARQKKNITNCPYGLAEVLNLRAVEYNMIDEDDASKKHIGLIAQEVKSVIDNAVDDLRDEDAVYGLDKSGLVPVLIKAIQELSAKNDALEARLVALEAK